MSVRGLVLFDPSGTAHSTNAIQGLVNAAARLEVTVVSQEQPRAPAGARLVWRERQVGGLLGKRRARRAYRQALLDTITAAPADHVVCDMGLGRTLRSRGRRIPASPRTVFIAHQSNAVDRTEGGDPRRRRVRGNQKVLTGLGRDGATFVAHTELMRRRLAEFVPDHQIRVHGWPVVGAADPCLAPDYTPTPVGVTLLFAGSARLEKGLPQLLRSIRDVTGFDRLVIPGRLIATSRDQLDLTDPRLDVWDRWLDAGEYRAAFAAASLVVLPYRRSYVNHGIFSSVLAEAMAYGRPLVVADALAQLIPADYGGAVVATDTEDGLAAALTDAIGRLPELEAAAMSAGRAHAAAHFTYEGYLASILAAGTSSSVEAGGGT